MSSNLTVTSQTLTFIVSLNAMRCAKVVLEGVAPELRGMHANPNCINRYGYFPIHEAAERFAVDMIKLLLRHGASANVRTVGGNVIENLLPLHVAVENTCLHKYLEDNLSLSQNPLDYIYKLIHLLCLPEMKIFLDTTRLLAEKTNNLLEELWKYIEDGKIIQSAVLLLAAQEQIRQGSSSKINGSSKTNGFDIINKCIMRLLFALKWEKDSHGMAQELLEERKKLTDCAWLLVDVFSHAGEDLSAYIKAHSEMTFKVRQVRSGEHSCDTCKASIGRFSVTTRAVSSSRVLQAPFCTLTRLKIKDWGAKYINCRCSFIGPADERKLTRSGSWIGVVGEEVDEVGAGAVASGAMGFAVLAVGDDDPDRSCPPCSSSRRAARAVLGCGRQDGSEYISSRFAPLLSKQICRP